MTQGTLEPLIATRIELLIGALGTATKVAESLGAVTLKSSPSMEASERTGGLP